MDALFIVVGDVGDTYQLHSGPCPLFIWVAVK